MPNTLFDPLKMNMMHGLDFTRLLMILNSPPKIPNMIVFRG